MLNVLTNISNIIIPVIIFYIVAYGLLSKSKVYEDIVPLIFVKMFSSSAATGLVLDIFKTHGTDSYAGLMTSIMMSCTETIFYTLSVYYMAAKVTKTKWTLSGALISTLAGIAASVVLAGVMT